VVWIVSKWEGEPQTNLRHGFANPEDTVDDIPRNSNGEVSMMKRAVC
jgi:hypothetical protein